MTIHASVTLTRGAVCPRNTKKLCQANSSPTASLAMCGALCWYERVLITVHSTIGRLRHGLLDTRGFKTGDLGQKLYQRFRCT